MKHEKEWYTCDRCGKEIKIPKDTNGLLSSFEVFTSPLFLAFPPLKHRNQKYLNKEFRVDLCYSCHKKLDSMIREFLRNEDI